MTPQLVTAIAYLIAEAVVAGTSIASLMREVERTGKVPPERWNEMLGQLDREVEEWRRKR